MGLFDFIEEQDGEGGVLHRPSQDALFFVPHIARWRADQFGDGMLLAVFGHIEDDEVAGRAE